MRGRINWITYLPIICGTVGAWVILLLDRPQEAQKIPIDGWVALVAALIGVAGAIIATFLQIRRDGKTIDGISTNIDKIKSTVDRTDEKVSTIKDTIYTMVAGVSSIQERTGKIDGIAAQVAVLSRLRAEAASSGVQLDKMIASMTTVFEENASLKSKLQSQNNELSALRSKNLELRSESALLQAENNGLRKRVDQLQTIQEALETGVSLKQLRSMAEREGSKGKQQDGPEL